MKKLFISLAVIALAASYSHAGNVQTFGVGAKASAQGEAVVAHSDDPFAVYYNPAGLSLIKRPVVSVGATVFDATVEIRNFSVTDTSGAETHSGPTDFDSTGGLIVNPNIGFAMPITDKWTFGIAAYAPYGLHIEWDRDPAKNPGAPYSWESKYVREVISPTLAYKVSDKLSVGFGVSLGKSITDSGKTLPFGIDPDNNAATAGTTELVMTLEDEFNYSFNAGIMYRPIDSLSLGLTYRGRTDADLEGDLLSDRTKIGTVSLDFDHPESVQAGVRYFMKDKFSIEVDATWTRWSINKEQVHVTDSEVLTGALTQIAQGSALKVAAADGSISPEEALAISKIKVANPYNETYIRDWEDTIQYKIGAEWKVAKNFALRAGYTYDPTPVPDETVDMGWPDTDRNVYNLGFGWDINENWTLDGVVQHVRSTSVRKIKGDSENMNDVYSSLASTAVEVSMEDEGILWGYGLNVSYKF